MKLKRILICLAIISSYNSFAQETSEKETPKDLMSSYYNENFNPFQKSNWMVSFNMAFKKENFKNANHNFENVLNGNQKSSNFQIAGAYFFSDNFAGKLGFGVGENRFEGQILKTFDTISRSSINKNYAVVPTLRTAIPVVPNKKLSLFVDLELSFGWGNTNINNTGIFGPTETSFAKSYAFGAGIKSGVAFFAMENFAIEIGLEVLSYKYNTSTTNNFDEPESKYNTHEVDFNIDILSLNLALTYYIGAKKDK